MTIFLACISLIEVTPFGLADKTVMFIIQKGKMQTYSELFYSLDLVAYFIFCHYCAVSSGNVCSQEFVHGGQYRQGWIYLLLLSGLCVSVAVTESQLF